MAALEELHFSFVLLGLLATVKGAEVSTPARFWIHFAGIEPVVPRFQLTNHFTYLRIVNAIKGVTQACCN